LNAAREREIDALTTAIAALRSYYADHPNTLDTADILDWIGKMGRRLEVTRTELAAGQVVREQLYLTSQDDE
jgi:hypothetical protein